MENLNRIELRGVVGTVRCQQSAGKKLYKFTLATSRAFRDKSNAAVIETTWHQVVAWESASMPDLERIEKGTKLYVCGRIHTREYTNSEAEEKSVVEVIANRVVLVDCEDGFQCEI